MRAVVCHRGELAVADVPAPRPGRGQLLLRVLRCGICGSDLHARHHADELRAAAAATGYEHAMGPEDRVVMGHELVGEVIGRGRRVGPLSGFRDGDRVVALPLRRAGGAVHLTGFSELAPGAYAEQVVVEASLALKVPDELSTDHAALTEPMAVALHAVRRGEVARGQVAVVVGCGPIGLAVITMLKATGVATVVASDLSPGRRELARACGADLVVDPRGEDLWAAVPGRHVTRSGQLLDLAVGSMEKLRTVPFVPWWHVMRAAEAAGAAPRGPVVFECVGVPGVIDHVVGNAPFATRVVVVGMTMTPDTFRPALAVMKEVDLRFVFTYTPREFRDTLQLLASDDVDPSPLLTGRVGLDGLAAAFDALEDPGAQAKILVEPHRPGRKVQPF